MPHIQVTSSVMNAIDKLKSLLREKPAPYHFTPDVFPQIDRERMKADLKLAERGKALGLKSLPKTQTDDSVESDIVARFEEERHRNTTIFREQLATFNKRLTDINLLAYFSNATDASRLAEGEFNAEIQKRQGNLTAERDNVIAARQHYTKFRADNRLTAAPDVPQSLLFNISIIFAILAIEGVMNGFFFQYGASNGLLGGIAQAFLFSLANVGVSVATGMYAVPYLYHIDFIKKLAGVVLTISYLWVLFSLNLIIAHYRDAIQVNPDTATHQALTIFLSNPLGIQDIQSVILAGMGIIFGLASVLDGLYMDDRYPGYGRAYRQIKRVYEEYNEKVDDAIDALTDIRDDAIQSLQQTREEALKRKAEYDAIQAHKTRLIAQFTSYLDYLETAANDLITFYRNENMQRSNQAFDSSVSVNPQELQLKSDSTGKQLQRSIQALHEAYDNSLPKFERIGEL